MKIMFFSNKNDRCNEVENWLKELNANYELINVDTKKGEKFAKDWITYKRQVPHLFFMSDDLKKTYYVDGVAKMKNTIKVIINTVEESEGKKKEIKTEQWLS